MPAENTSSFKIVIIVANFVGGGATTAQAPTFGANFKSLKAPILSMVLRKWSDMGSYGTIF